jgi:hypothetical protein
MEVKPSHETLLFSANGILPIFTLLMSAFSLQLCPNKETLFFYHVLNVPLPSNLILGQNLGILLRPDTFSVLLKHKQTIELLRFH